MSAMEAKTVRGPKPTRLHSVPVSGVYLSKLCRQTSPQQQVRRAIILSMADGKNNPECQPLGYSSKQSNSGVCWLEVPRLTAAEVTQVSDKELLAMIEALEG